MSKRFERPAKPEDAPVEVRCGTCRFCGRHEGGITLVCKRYPPVVLEKIGGGIYSVWPRMGKDDRCGEWAPIDHGDTESTERN